ncbi:MAG: hypothetical protein NT169_21615 [Chloroflexi bacterium]|nr:hypothetical protein [Chloroflexota bacterium]
MSNLQGDLYFTFKTRSYSAYETFPLMIRAFPGSSAINTVTIRPAADASGLSMTSSASEIIYLQDVSNVILDGRPGGVGSNSELTIGNTSASGNAVYFDGSTGSTHNTLQYLTITGVGQSVVEFFRGSNDNVIDHSEVRGSATQSCSLIFAYDDISGNTITNNRLHHFYCGGDSAAVWLDNGVTGGWTITGNSIYQDAPPTLTPRYQYGIWIKSGDGYTITDNIIGGSQPDGGGAAWTCGDLNGITTFDGIYLNAGTTTASSIQGNTIANITLLSKANIGYWARLWSGITVASGAVNISSNTIGSGTGTGSVQVTG